MKIKSSMVTGVLIALSGLCAAQSGPPPPAPIVETELRDNTTKMRSIELERVKREADQVRTEEYSKEQIKRFEATRRRFENIQKLQDAIVKAYTTGKRINYSKIERSASDMTRDALLLNEDLFGADPDREEGPETGETKVGRSVKDLIVELDNAIGAFVANPIFQNTRVVDTKMSKEAQLELRRIVKLSTILSIEAERMK